MGGVKAVATTLLAGAALFSSAANAAPQVNTLYPFSGKSDGGKPATTFAYDPASNMLYGVTPNISMGGPHCAPNCGTLFSFDPSEGGNGYALLHTFSGRLRGADPQGALLFLKGELYGTTAAGGAYDQGTLFKFELKTGKFKVIHHFAGGTDGATPLGQLTPTPEGISPPGLFGTTAAGGLGGCGAAGCGTVFEVTDFASDHPEESVIYAFQGNKVGDGQLPQSPLISDGVSTLFGTTVLGGQTPKACATGCGTVFKIDLTGQPTYTRLYAFQGDSDGISPQGLLVYDNQKAGVYGVTPFGGGACTLNNQQTTCGTVYSVDSNGSGEQSLSSFSNTNASTPVGGLCVHRGAQLLGYGPTAAGGTANLGTLFSARFSNGGAPTVIYNFSGGPNGQTPLGGLTAVAGTGFFGTTSAGGNSGCNNGCGTIFMLKP